MDTDNFYIQTTDGRYFCCSPQTGFYFTYDLDDVNIIDGSELEFRFSKQDTINQIKEQVKEKKGVNYSRHDLFQHPAEKAWLACERKVVRVTEGGNKIKQYEPFWSRKYKLVTCISRTREKCQGNAGFKPGSSLAKQASEKSRIAKKKRLETAQEVARELGFNPMKRLALFAMGDQEALGLSERVSGSTQLKSIELFLKYSHQALKPYDPDAMNGMNDSGPRINLILPSDGSGDSKNKGVLVHKDQDSVNDYLETGEVNKEFQDTYARLELPDEDEQ